jgi:hypothetical protein
MGCRPRDGRELGTLELPSGSEVERSARLVQGLLSEPESPGNSGKRLRPQVEDAPGMVLAPRRAIHDWRAAVYDRPNVRDYPTTLTETMIE